MYEAKRQIENKNNENIRHLNLPRLPLRRSVVDAAETVLDVVGLNGLRAIWNP